MPVIHLYCDCIRTLNGQLAYCFQGYCRLCGAKPGDSTEKDIPTGTIQGRAYQERLPAASFDNTQPGWLFLVLSYAMFRNAMHGAQSHRNVIVLDCVYSHRHLLGSSNSHHLTVFLSLDSMLSALYAIANPSVRPSVTRADQ